MTDSNQVYVSIGNSAKAKRRVNTLKTNMPPLSCVPRVSSPGQRFLARCVDATLDAPAREGQCEHKRIASIPSVPESSSTGCAASLSVSLPCRG